MTTPTFGSQFVVRWIVHVIPDVAPNTKFLCNRSEDIKGSINYKIGHMT